MSRQQLKEADEYVDCPPQTMFITVHCVVAVWLGIGLVLVKQQLTQIAYF